MAVEAVIKIKEAEVQGREILRKANDTAWQIIQSAAKESAEKRDAILGEARKVQSRLLDEAAQKAQTECETLGACGASERETILNPGEDKLNRAINFITERIVRV